MIWINPYDILQSIAWSLVLVTTIGIVWVCLDRGASSVRVLLSVICLIGALVCMILGTAAIFRSKGLL